jgi:hypothetical protein
VKILMAFIVNKDKFFTFKTMAEAFIKFSMEWWEVPTTCEPCIGCEEIIYGKQYQLFVIGVATNNIICESCYLEVIKED